MLESVLIHFAVVKGLQQTRQGDGGKAIAYLRDNGHLPERDGGDFLRGLWRMTHTNGPLDRHQHRVRLLPHVPDHLFQLFGEFGLVHVQHA